MIVSHESAKARRVEKIEKRLKFIAVLRNERSDATSDHAEYVGLENIQSWTGKLLPNTASNISESDDSASGTANVFYQGDVLFGKLRPYLAKALHVEKDGVCSTELLVLKPQLGIHPRFLLYSMLSPDFVGQVDATTFGAKMPRANWEFIGSMKLPVPGYESQGLIAEYLDRETAHIDALIAEKEKMLALLEEKRVALISRAVTLGLSTDATLKPSNAPWFDQTPSSWSVERLKWVIKSVTSGVSVNASDHPAEGDSLGVLKTSAVAGGAFFFGENKSVWDTEYDRLACPVSRNTIIMSRMNTPNLVGESGYVVEDYPNLFLPDRLWQISFDENRVFVPFMSLLLATKEARHALSSMATGTSPSMKNLAIEEMSSLLIPVPTLDEQKLIYNEVVRQDATIGPLKNELANSLKLLKERRSALITDAVTGQIPVEEMAP